MSAADDATPIEVALKRLMLAYGFATIDVARATEAPPSRVSAVLRGDVPVPQNWPERIAAAFALDADDSAFLNQAAAASRLGPDDEPDAVTAAFLDGLTDGLDEAERQSLQSLLAEPCATTRRRAG